jgi:hypothetical protein
MGSAAQREQWKRLLVSGTWIDAIDRQRAAEQRVKVALRTSHFSVTLKKLLNHLRAIENPQWIHSNAINSSIVTVRLS